MFQVRNIIAASMEYHFCEWHAFPLDIIDHVDTRTRTKHQHTTVDGAMHHPWNDEDEKMVLS